MANNSIECVLCCIRTFPICFPTLCNCEHRFCYNCLQRYLEIEITESRIEIHCPSCQTPIHPNDIQTILNNDTLLKKYESFMVRSVLLKDPDARWCPAPDCGYAVIARKCADCPQLKCEKQSCSTNFCYHCRQVWHPNMACNSVFPGISSFENALQTTTRVKNCPQCRVPIIKKEGGYCNHMTCSMCKFEFCWLCLNSLSPLHYFGESSCTMFGTRPMNQKQRIVKQLLILATAPVLIPLVALTLVAYSILFMPVKVGKSLYTAFDSKTGKGNRNWMVFIGATGYTVLAVIFAPLTAIILTPFLLIYTCVVIFYSMCYSFGSSSTYRQHNGESHNINLGPGISCSNEGQDSNVEKFMNATEYSPLLQKYENATRNKTKINARTRLKCHDETSS